MSNVSAKPSWSTTTPTEAGWYWIKVPASMHPLPVELSAGLGVLDGLYMNMDPVEYGTAMHIDQVVKIMNGVQWAGPIPKEFIPDVKSS